LRLKVKREKRGRLKKPDASSEREKGFKLLRISTEEKHREEKVERHQKL